MQAAYTWDKDLSDIFFGNSNIKTRLNTTLHEIPTRAAGSGLVRPIQRLVGELQLRSSVRQGHGRYRGQTDQRLECVGCYNRANR